VFDSFNRSSVTDAGTTLEANVEKKYNGRDVDRVESYLNAGEIGSGASPREVRATAEEGERVDDGSPAAIAAELSVDCYSFDERTQVGPTPPASTRFDSERRRYRSVTVNTPSTTSTSPRRGNCPTGTRKKVPSERLWTRRRPTSRQQPPSPSRGPNW
jgi:hypothetical protein